MEIETDIFFFLAGLFPSENKPLDFFFLKGLILMELVTFEDIKVDCAASVCQAA